MSARSSRVFALLAVAFAACTSPPPTANTSGAPSATVSPSASSVTPSPTASSVPLPTGRPTGGIEARPLGALTGEWAFVTSVARAKAGDPLALGDVSELWAIPLGGGEPRLAVRYASGSAGGNAQNNVIGRQFSSDGRRIVLSVATPRPRGGSRFSMEIVELETGRVMLLGSDDADGDLTPAWSPDGMRIAYRRVPDAPSGGAFDDGVWWMGADGSGVRRLVPGTQGQSTIVHEWTPDSRAVAFSYVFEEATFAVVDVVSGARARIGAYVTELRGHSWRAVTPLFAGAFLPTPKSTPQYVLVTDAPGSPEQVLVRETDPDVLLGNVRWHPARNEVLYVRGAQGARELYALELGGSPARIPTTGRPLQAEWSPTGNEIVYLHGGDAQLPLVGATELRTVRRDGTSERAVFVPRSGAVLTDLAVRRYP